MSSSTQQRKIKDPNVLKCSTDQVKKFVFVHEKDFLCEFLPKMETYKKKRDRVLKLKRKLPPKMYLKHLQSLREELLSDVSILKKKYSKEVTDKYEPNELQNKDNLTEKEKKKLNMQKKMMEQKMKIKKLKEEFKGNFEFFKADVQIGQNKNGK
jgi:hypothetical protein